MDQFQLSFAGKQINGGGILEGRNKKRVFFSKRVRKACMYDIHMYGNMAKWDQSLILLIRDMVVDGGTDDLAVKPYIPHKSLLQ